MDKRKLFGTILGSIAFIVFILVTAYAFYVWRSEETDVTINISDSYFYCESGKSDTIALKALASYYGGGEGTYVDFTVNNIGRQDSQFSISMNITSASSSDLFTNQVLYQIVVDETGGNVDCTTGNCTEVVNGDFSNFKVGMNTLAEDLTIPNNSRYKYYVFLYLGNGNNTSLEDATIDFTLDVCEIVAFLDSNGGTVTSEFVKITGDTYGETSPAIPTPTKSDTTIKYDSNGGSSVSDGKISYTYGGWYLDEGTWNKKVESTTKVETTINHKLYAKWLPTSITLPTAPTRTGYTFKGWKDEDGDIYDASSSYTLPYDTSKTSVTLTAQWQANTYKITTTANGGTITPSTTTPTYDTEFNIKATKTITVTGNANGTGATIGTATSKKQTFAGWTSTSGLNTSTAKYGTTSGSATTSWSNASTKVGAETTYFKNLTPTSGGTVALTANWTAVAVTLPTVTKTGYTCGWNESSTGTTIQYESGDSYTPGANDGQSKTMYAVCKANTVTVNIYKDGSAWSASGMNVALYSGTTSTYAYSAGTASGSTVTWSGIKAGTYNVYAGKNSTSKTTLVDTGVDVTVSTGKTTAGTGTATINYYTLTLTAGTGISSVTGAAIYLSNQTASISATVINGYTFSKWFVNSGNTPVSTTTASTTVSTSKATSLTANAVDSTPPEKPTITRTDYNTFSYTATDGVEVTCYYVSKTNTKPSAPTSTCSTTEATVYDTWTTTTKKDINGAGTYYVWAVDAAGNISSSVSISAYTVTRSVGTGSTLETRYDYVDTSNTGTSFTANTSVLSGTNVWAQATANSGYNTPVLKRGSTTQTNPSAATVTADVTISSSATANTYTVNYVCKDGTGDTKQDSDPVIFGQPFDVDDNTNCSRKGYNFSTWEDTTGVAWNVGWSTTSWPYVNGQLGITDNVLTLNSTWTAKTYTVTYSCGDGEGEDYVDPEKATYNQKYTVLGVDDTNCSYDGYSFAGWKDPTNVSWTGWSGTWVYDNGQYGISNEKLTLTAQWTVDTYAVTLDSNCPVSSGSTAGTPKVYYQYNATKVIDGVTCYYYTDSALNTCLSGRSNIVVPTCPGHIFKGYFTSTGGSGTGTQYVSSSGGFINNVYKTTGDKTLYAEWEEIVTPTVPEYSAFHPEYSNKAYTSGTWTNKLVHTTLSTTYSGSYPVSMQYTLTSNDTSVDSNWSTFGFSAGALTKSGTTYTGTEPWGLRDRDNEYYFRACVTINSKLYCSDVSDKYRIKYDILAPKQSDVTYTAFHPNDNNSSYTSGTWTNKQVYTTISAKDDASSGVGYSDIAYIQYREKDSSTWNTFNFAMGNLAKDESTSIWSGTESWGMTNGRNNYYYFRACDSVVDPDGEPNCSSIPTDPVYNIRYDTEPPTVTITRSDYNTFSWTASDTNGVTGYAITTSSTAPTSWTTTGTLTSGTYDISSAGTYYVWAKDEAGNTKSASIGAYTVTRSQGTGTTLTTRYDSTSSSTGSLFTDNLPMLAGTPIWAKATANSGYTGVTLKHGSTSMTASGGTFNVSADETIASTATKSDYKVTFNVNGGNAWTSSTCTGTGISLSSSTCSKTVTNGSTYGTLPTPTRDGYIFIGWFTSNATYDTSKAYKDYPLYYYADTYSDLYSAFGYNQQNLYNHYYNYTLNGSETRRVSQYISTDTVSIISDTTFYAGWYDSSSPTATITTTSTLKSTSQTATLACTDNIGVTSYYWGTSSTGTPNTSVTSTTSMSVTKTVNSAGTYYLICQDSSGNISTSSTTYYSYTVNNLLEKISGTTGTYTVSNYEEVEESTNTYIAPSGTKILFSSVYTVPTGGVFAVASVGTASTTPPSTTYTNYVNLQGNKIYSIWFNRLTYALTLNKGTGISSVSGAGTYKYGASASINATVSTGYSFSSWTINSGNTPSSTTSASTTVKITQTTTLTAVGKANTYTVTYSCNGGTGTVSSTSHTYGVAKALAATSGCSRTGYTVNGWNTAANGSGTAYTSGQSVTNLTSTNGETVPLYAQWTANTATITIKKGGSAWSSSGINVALYSGTTAKYAYSAGTASGSTVTWSAVTAGTYNVYASMGNGDLTTLVDTGVDVTVTSSGAATINYYTVTRSVGTGSTLTTRYNSTSSSTGTAFKASTKVLLSGTNVWAQASASTGYNSPVLKRGGSTVTNPSYVALTSDITIASSATAVTVAITLNANGCGTISGTNPFNARYASSTISMPTFTVTSGYHLYGWYTAASGGSKVLTSAGAFTGTAVSGYTSASAWAATSAKTLYAQCVNAVYSVQDSSGNVKDYYDNLYSAINSADATTYNVISLLHSSHTEYGGATFNKSLTFKIPSGRTLTLSGGSLVIDSGATVTKTGTGTIAGTGDYMTFDVYGKLILKEGTVKSDSYTTIFTYDTSQLEVNGATISMQKSDGYWAIRNQSSNTSNAVNITSGTINSAGGGIYTDTDADITISGGTISVTGSTRAVKNAGTGTITMTGGTIKCGDTICVENASTGTMDLKSGSISSKATAVYNSSTGRINLGMEKQTTKNYAITISGTGASSSTIYCGSTSGSKALCYIFEGANITSTTGRAATNYNGQLRVYKYAKLTCSANTYYACIKNTGTYSSGYGQVYVRQGTVQSVAGAIRNEVANINAVVVGYWSDTYQEDTLYNSTSYKTDAADGTLEGTGPIIRASEGYGVQQSGDAESYSWKLVNGMVGGTASEVYGASNKAPTSYRSGYSVSKYTDNTTAFKAAGYKYYHLTAS